jgi:ribulose-phosphate 3-epimerase
MDGHFVPALTYGPPIVRALRRLTELPLDVHLMIARPHDQLAAFVDAGADMLTFHAEAVSDLPGMIGRIHGFGVAAGVAINPATSVEVLHDCLAAVDLVLVMSVQPGAGGQTFNPVALDKLRRLKELVGDEVLLEVDGGINEDTIAPSAEAGADLFAVGSAIFKEHDYRKKVHELNALLSA